MSDPFNSTLPPSGQSCGACAYFVGHRCLRFPPSVFANGPNTFVSIWPTVVADDWCAEYKIIAVVPPEPPVLSPDGSTLVPSDVGGSLVTAHGVWTFSNVVEARGNIVLLNGTQAADGAGTLLQVNGGGQMFRSDTTSAWLQWLGDHWGTPV